MVLVRTRDYPAFVVLFDRYRARAVSFAARMTGDADEAEAIAHDAFVQVPSRASGYSPKHLFAHWFFSLLRKLVFERVSKRDPAPRASLEQIAALQPVSKEQPSSAHAEAAKRIYKALNRLKPVYREVLYLRVFERMSYDEIAAVTGEKLATALGRMNYAVEHLRSELRQ